jgi:excisionase family DNA binding protein
MSTSAQSGAGRTPSGSSPRRPRAERDDTAEANIAEAGLAEVRFLTVAEVATVMRVSKMTVYRMVHSGDLPAVRVGRSFRVPEKAVHDYLRSAYIEAG